MRTMRASTPKVTLTCKHCEKSYVLREAALRSQEKASGQKRQFCSQACSFAARVAASNANAPTFECAHCGALTVRKRVGGTGQFNMKPRFCGRECQSLASKNNAGLPLGQKDRHGYIWVFTGGRNGKYIPQHRTVMSEMIGRPLRPEETVHHKNGVRDDNRPENLELWSSRHGKGQRVSDKIAFAAEFLKSYGFDTNMPNASEYVFALDGVP